jgi:hypothetical protein
VKSSPVRQSKQPRQHAITRKRRVRRCLSWARLLKRVFDIDHCPNCGGSMKSIAAIRR